MTIEIFTHLDDPRVAYFHSLTDVAMRSKLEPEKGIFIAESYKIIKRALSAGYEPISFLSPENRLEDITTLLKSHSVDVPVYTAPDEVLAQLSGFPIHRAELGAFRRKPLIKPEVLVEGAKRIAVLDAITNHTNIGAIFRSAAALNVDAILVSPECHDPLYRRALRISMGATLQIPWTRFGGDAQTWKEQGTQMLHDLGFTTMAFALKEDSISLNDPQLASVERMAMIFGTEGDGLSFKTIDGCDLTVKIPMFHGVDSLNVAAASAVAFWELCARE